MFLLFTGCAAPKVTPALRAIQPGEGGKTVAQIVEHNAHDELVAWGWSPGAGREPVPGTQEQLGALVAAWVETGAACPEEDR